MVSLDNDYYTLEEEYFMVAKGNGNISSSYGTFYVVTWQFFYNTSNAIIPLTKDYIHLMVFKTINIMI